MLRSASVEVAELRRFREALRSDASLRAAYEARKQAILDEGVLEPTPTPKRTSCGCGCAHRVFHRATDPAPPRFFSHLTVLLEE